MNNPIKIWRELKSIYLKYIDSGLPLSDDRLAEERRKLFDEPGAICQPPIIELVSNYETPNDVTLSQVCNHLEINNEFADFVRLGLFQDSENGEERRLYKHQKDAIEFALKKRMHIVATTGTGSGKTECFLLPVIGDLIEESKRWNEKRTRAVRTLILYPLNALAEDQMIRLRKTVNSSYEDKTGSRDWLNKYRKDRFYFGRYTGKTPFSGNKDARYSQEKEELTRNWDAAKKSGVNDFLYHIPCMDENSSEMWDRWSMQETPPDILITNYSMLNIMLMRKQEDSIFDKTKQWLQEDERNVFHLVVDEMHTYRGTAGTEVAYLIRLLLKRLGLEPDSNKVQFLASSASMQENERTEEYLASFFGVKRSNYKQKFKLLRNPETPLISKPTISIPAELFAKDIDQIEKLDSEAAGELSQKYSLKDWSRYAMQNKDGSLTAKNIYELAKCLFEKDDEHSVSAIEGILVAIGKAKTPTGAAIQPMRAHYFFRNIDGLWACTNPDCTEVEEKYKWGDRKIGKLYRNPGKAYCSCGGKILELLICRSCGEPYFWGYKLKESGKRFVVCDPPYNDDDQINMLTIWPGNMVLPKDDKDKKKKSIDLWTNHEYDCYNGNISNYRSPNNAIVLSPNEFFTKFPDICPKCGVEYQVEDSRSLTPISKHSTGVQKVNQVMADALMRTMRQENNRPKLVLFSDSRQAAAKLSAGIELDHYRDVLRQVVYESLSSEDEKKAVLKKFRDFKKDGKELGENEKKQIMGLMTDPYLKQIVHWISNKGYNLPEDDFELDRYFSNTNASRLEQLEAKVDNALLKKGMNPIGAKPSRLSNSELKELFKWENEKVFRRDYYANSERKIKVMQEYCLMEQLITVFAHKKRSFESMKLGYVTTDIKEPDPKFFQFVDLAIRIMGEEWRIKNHPSKYDRDYFPKNVGKIAKEVFKSTTKKSILDKLQKLLADHEIIAKNEKILTGKGLLFKKSQPGDSYWVCSKCNSVHLHPSCGVCYNCLTPLGSPKLITNNDLIDSNDYYLYLATFPETFRLHCEELTGQTSKEDSTKRQRHFQGFFQDEEVPRVDEIDLLSVTTTMEAGVDIGSLSAVMMGNVPPQRFNYQQRVGRAGRRGHSFSIALTIAKGNSHDQTHYQQTDRMVSSIPKDPYLEIHSSEIAERMIIKEVLRESFKEINFNKGKTDNVHGDFGKGFYWKENREKVANWIENNHEEIWNIINCLSKETDLNIPSSALFTSITDELISKIDNVVNDQKKYPQDDLSEKLANAGLLPMFGFPTRVRSLFEKEPEKLPATEVVDREIDIAISAFAPGCEIVKDKKVLKSVGFVTYKSIKGSKPIEFEGLNPLDQELLICKDCKNTSISGELQCECSKGDNIDRYKVCSPLGFCVDYDGAQKDFNGIFEWNPVTTSVSIDSSSELDYKSKIKNLNLSTNTVPRTGLVNILNTNEGNLFNIGRYNNTKRYCVKDAFEPDRLKEIRVSKEEKMALIASKTTGILTASINKTNANTNISPLKDNPNHLAVESAFISWGFLIRKAVCDFLDIETNEVNVGFRINSGQGEIYIIESLENGAGYCNYLSGRIHGNIPEDALLKPLLGNGTVYKDILMKKEHLENCDSSCYDCIRDYYNQQYHSILNWRLGLDLARLANDPSCIIDFRTEYWVSYIEKIVSQLSKKMNGKMIGIENRTFVIKGVDSSYLITHPFWSKQFVDELKTKLDYGVVDIAISEVLRKIRS